MEKEIYLPIKGYEGFYKVSNLGNIMSDDRFVPDGRTEKFRKLKGKVIKFSKGNYYSVSLSKNKIKKRHLVHRLVCESFLEKLENKNIVNHKDSNRYNNNVENLEWCTSKENYEHAKCKGNIVSYWAGKKRSNETIEKIRKSKIGVPSKKIGTTVSDEVRLKISNKLKGKTPWNKGLKTKNNILK
jgi:hypothetical protein